jgi:4-hydroxy-tetrahydrodipicolinate synthase
MRKPIDRLSGSITALATPFRDGRIDEAAQVALVERQILRGTAALVVCGSTGEAAMLSLAEHAHNVRLVVSVAAGRVPVIAGCTAQATADACALAVAAVRAGADGLLLAPPPYVKPTQLGIIAHTTAVARAADLPIVLYDVPSRVGVAIADTTVANLSDAGHVIAVKDATGDLSRPPRLRDLCGPGLLQFTGEDSLAGAYRAMGGHGCISVTANVAPALCAALHSAWDAGDLARHVRLRDLLAPLHAALFAESNPIPLKAALAQLHLCLDGLRAPLTPASPTTHDRLAGVLARILPAEDREARPRSAPRLVAPHLMAVG